MKKTLCLILAAAFILGGCSKKTETMVCNYTLGSNSAKNTIESEGDNVLSQKITQKRDVSNLGMSEDQLNDAIDKAKDLYDIDGVKYSAKLNKNLLTETIEIDFEKADLDELNKASLISVPTGEDKVDYISLKTSKESLESAGYKCK